MIPCLTVNVADRLIESHKACYYVRSQDFFVLVGGGEVIVEEEMLHAEAKVELDPLGEKIVFIAEYRADGKIKLLSLFVESGIRVIENLRIVSQVFSC